MMFSLATIGSTSSKKDSRRTRPRSVFEANQFEECSEDSLIMSEKTPVALVTGVGPGTGAAISRRFSQGGYRVAMLARTPERLDELQREIPNAKGYPCDVTDETQLDSVIAAVRWNLGAPKVLVHNAVGGAIGNFMEIDPKALADNFQVNTMALLYLARRLAPAMVEAGEGAIVVTGNTSALRGKPRFAGFAPTKAAQRILAESIARELGPKGVHVAYVVIDAVIDLEWTRAMTSKPADDPFFIQPSAIADEIWHVVHQDRSAWSFNVEVRPFREAW
jgi:NAD(P)-dependent dehydrogenase (short-subunit alcohol dehydrogenase family)